MVTNADLIAWLQDADVTSRHLQDLANSKQRARKTGSPAPYDGLTMVEAIIAWALAQPDVRRIMAETVAYEEVSDGQ